MISKMVPVVAANRYGTEILLHSDGVEQQRIHFYGKSFITDATGAIVEEANDSADILFCDIDVAANTAQRAAFGLFRDRRPDLYQSLLTKDGKTMPL
jgi:N-carbamoylputrescine amidase